MRNDFFGVCHDGQNRADRAAPRARLPLASANLKDLLARVMRLARLTRFYDGPTGGAGTWDAPLRLDPVLALAEFFDKQAVVSPDLRECPAVRVPEEYEENARTVPETLLERLENEFDEQERWLETLRKAGLSLTLPPCPLPVLPEDDPEVSLRLCRGVAVRLGQRRSLLLEQAEAAFSDLLERPAGNLHAHTGLLLAFLRQYQDLTRKVNRLDEMFTEYFYEQRLGLRPAPAEPDRAVLVALLPEGTPSFTLARGTRFCTADPPLLYRATEPTPLNTARVSRVLALMPPATPGPFLMQHPWENFEAENSQGSWQPFHTGGEQHFQACPTLLSLPSLFLEGGNREVELTITFAPPADPAAGETSAEHAEISSCAALRQAWEQDEGSFAIQPLFHVAVSTGEGWLEPAETQIIPEFHKNHQGISEPAPGAMMAAGSDATSDGGVAESGKEAGEAGAPKVRDQVAPFAGSGGEEAAEMRPAKAEARIPSGIAGLRLRISMRVPGSAPALVPPSPEIHGVAAAHPSIRLTPRVLESGVWAHLARYRPERLTIFFTVTGLRHAELVAGGAPVADGGNEPFAAFGQTPARGSSIELRVPELRNKKLRALSLRWDWNPPKNFAGYFRAYPFEGIAACPQYRSPGHDGWQSAGPAADLPGGATDSLEFPPGCVPAGVADFRWKLCSSGSLFGHADYPALLARAVRNESGLLRKLRAWMRRDVLLSDLNPPYTPLWSDPNVGYTAEASHDLTAAPGIIRHCSLLPELLDEQRRVESLFAHYPEAMLAICLENAPSERAFPVSLYLRLQRTPPKGESGGPAAAPAPELLHARLIQDHTLGLSRSGLMRALVFRSGHETIQDNDTGPPSAWMAFRLPGPPLLTLRGVHAQAFIAEQVLSADPSLPDRPYPLPQGSVSTPVPPPYEPLRAETDETEPAPDAFPDYAHGPEEEVYAALLATLCVTQPYPSEGGRPSALSNKGREGFYAESAEFLRHRGQAVLPRDYETLLLRHFPEVLAARCLAHTDERGNSSPGSVRVAVLAPPVGARLHIGPDTGDSSGSARFRLDPCQPCFADSGLVARMGDFLSRRAGPSVAVHAAQPRFVPLALRLRVRLMESKSREEACKDLRAVLAASAAPWADNPPAAVLGAVLTGQTMLGAVHGVSGVAHLEELAIIILLPDKNEPVFFARDSREFPEAEVSQGFPDGLFYVDCIEVIILESASSPDANEIPGGRHDF